MLAVTIPVIDAITSFRCFNESAKVGGDVSASLELTVAVFVLAGVGSLRPCPIIATCGGADDEYLDIP
jgi:hypothetical protein